jgi:hypothetical protein
MTSSFGKFGSSIYFPSQLSNFVVSLRSNSLNCLNLPIHLYIVPPLAAPPKVIKEFWAPANPSVGPEMNLGAKELVGEL